METKVAQKGSIIANSMNRERILPVESALKDIYGLNDNEITLKVDEIKANRTDDERLSFPKYYLSLLNMRKL
jgi:hypothetical protein